VRRVHVDGYRHTLAGAPSTVARTLAALSSFYRYAMAEDATHLNPVQTVTRPRVDADHSSTQGLTRDQAEALLRTARAHGLRSNALVNVLLFTGVRISEALGATTADYGQRRPPDIEHPAQGRQDRQGRRSRSRRRGTEPLFGHQRR